MTGLGLRLAPRWRRWLQLPRNVHSAAGRLRECGAGHVVFATVELTIICATAAAKSAAQPIVQAAISTYIGGLAVAAVPATGAPPNGVLAYNKLAQLAFGATSAVLNISALTLNGGAADIGGMPGTVVRVAGVTGELNGVR